ncbi:MAG: hypothetical protein WBP11_10865, partial [Dokdonella sp.]
MILTSDSVQTQGMAMVLAITMARQGAKVNVLLCDTAATLKPKDLTPGQKLRGLVKQGGVATVCAL